ncbi:hypothetical protein [Arundinibacter roseus]|uniref:Uncharacterized protein n=1 Tax=Arundinibacter roseus TaxID=2070510 RepID=A0A4R4KM95_9BACT|nr:hypothetical protein [Arundinibacter roseus]TDB68112.1 hypothetical protein EZE20_04095 [Arundinibacter roseus]
MKIHLIDGHFESRETIELLTQLVHVKIKFQESKITAASVEEDIKMREKRIKELQKELFEVRQFVAQNHAEIALTGTIELHVL